MAAKPNQEIHWMTDDAKLKAVKAKLKAEGLGLRCNKMPNTYIVIDPNNGGAAVAKGAMTIEELYDYEIADWAIFKDVFESDDGSAPFTVSVSMDKRGELELVMFDDEQQTSTSIPVKNGLVLIAMGNRLNEVGAEWIANEMRKANHG